MSKRRKETNLPTKVQEIQKVELVSYQEFFQECLAKKIVKSWQEREISAFFKDLGLSNKESADTYKIALNKF